MKMANLAKSLAKGKTKKIMTKHSQKYIGTAKGNGSMQVLGLEAKRPPTHVFKSPKDHLEYMVIDMGINRRRFFIIPKLLKYLKVHLLWIAYRKCSQPSQLLVTLTKLETS